MPEPSRQRLDYETLPGGAVKAILTVTLPGGVVKRYTVITDPKEAHEVSGTLTGLCGQTSVGISIFKRVGRLAKSVAHSKVFALAASGLALAAPLLGPAAPFALAAAAGMGVAAKLAKAGIAAAHGALDVAKELTHSAHADAVKLTTTPEGARSLMEAANKKRLAAEKLADKAEPIPKPPPPPSRAAAPRGATSDQDILSAANAGRVRSNQPGPISSADLLAAHATGRVFWVV